MDDKPAHKDSIGAGRRPAPEPSSVIPTIQGARQRAAAGGAAESALSGVEWEVIFVDDNSPDGTADVVRKLGETDARVRCIRRIGRRGLAGACLEGMLASQARYVAVMDADLQHDENLLAGMLSSLRNNECDLVVASRYLDAGSAASLSGTRAGASRFASGLARRFLRVDLSDPMSGFS